MQEEGLQGLLAICNAGSVHRSFTSAESAVRPGGPRACRSGLDQPDLPARRGAGTLAVEQSSVASAAQRALPGYQCLDLQRGSAFLHTILPGLPTGHPIQSLQRARSKPMQE